jgi:hypothetical protein
VIGPFFKQSNCVEASFWIAIAAAVLLWARRRRALGPVTYVLAATLVLFGVSDLVEAQTGAWWRPWWLLVWKGMCLAVFVGLLVRARRARVQRGE